MSWDWFTVLAAAGFVATSVAMFVTLSTLSKLFTRMVEDDPPGPRIRRLTFRRMGITVGSWQIASGLLIASLGQWTSSIALIGMGGLFLFGAHLARKFGIAPWWAPEVRRD